MSHSPVTPRRAIRANSSSGTWSRVRIGRSYERDSWSSQTFVLLHRRTSSGIQATSWLNRSGSASPAGRRRRPRVRPSRRWPAPSGPRTPATEPGSLLGDDAQADEQALEEPPAGRAEQVAPAVAHEGELAGEGRR